MPHLEENIGRTNPWRPERPKNYADRLKGLLTNISEKLNQEIEKEYGLYNFLNPDCTISMEGYADTWGGIYSEEKVESDNKEASRLDEKFSKANNPNVQALYEQKYGIKNKTDLIRRWKINKEKEKNNQMEMAVIALFSKILKENFLIVRTATYDDYLQGVDNIIVNKRTGEAICAFDDFHEGGQGERTEEKQKKMKGIEQKGGAQISYGVAFKEGKLVRSEMKNIPVFTLGLDSKDLDDLLENMSFYLDEPPTPKEYEIFFKLRKSIIEQQKAILGSSKTAAALRKSLNNFQESLALIEMVGETLH